MLRKFWFGALCACPLLAMAQMPTLVPAPTPAAEAAADSDPTIPVDPQLAAEQQKVLTRSRFACEENKGDAGEGRSTSKNVFANFSRNADRYTISNAACGLSLHKAMFVLPATYSPDYPSSETELIFQISAKQSLFGTNIFVGYTQRSFWQVYDSQRSRPFRETNYNPELFYRWIALDPDWLGWGADVGIEHESNGQDIPDSRSWNRIYFAPFRAKGKTGVYLKTWFRLPEDDKETPDDPKGDDNPDIDDYYGYTELHVQKQIGRQQLISGMFRINPATGKGALNLNYTIPSNDGYLFYQVYLWHGYGESLLDYNDSVTRIGFGVALAR